MKTITKTIEDGRAQIIETVTIQKEAIDKEIAYAFEAEIALGSTKDVAKLLVEYFTISNLPHTAKAFEALA